MFPAITILGDLLLRQLFTFRPFQDIVIQYQVHFDRNHYGHLPGHLQHFALLQYRALYSERCPAADYPSKLSKWTPGFILSWIFFSLYLVRGLLVVFVLATTDTREKRILLGLEQWSHSAVYIESTFLLWSTIIVCFLSFSLTPNLLDYKFLSVWAMSPTAPAKYLHPDTFALPEAEYRRFARFRSGTVKCYYAIMLSIPGLAPIAVALLFARESLFETNPIASTTWLVIITLYTFYGCIVLYSPLAVFVVVARYIELKQHTLISRLHRRFALLLTLRQMAHCGNVLLGNLLTTLTRYSTLQEELSDYGHFWSVPLTIAFINYCSLLAYISYIIPYSSTSLVMKVLYGIIWFFHVLVFSSVTASCAVLVRRHQQLAIFTSGQVARLVTGVRTKMTLGQLMKIHNIAAHMKLTQLGFTLVNDYLITPDTFRVIIVNIAIYFMLAFHP